MMAVLVVLMREVIVLRGLIRHIMMVEVKEALREEHDEEAG